jgi:homoserine O-acetyltransferase
LQRSASTAARDHPTVLKIVIAVGLVLAAVSACAPTRSGTNAQGQPGEFVVHNFRFRSGETLADLRLHYITLGTPRRGAAGHVTNAVLILHATEGSGSSLIRPEFSGQLFGPGQLLDAQRYYLILPDDIGHGKSSKPSDGLRARFPHYDYADMIQAEHQLVHQGLHVDHLRLVLGLSMGCMHAFMWGEAWPTEMDALMPLACLPAPIAGRNRLWRAMIVDAIRSDPAWKNGDYTEEPREALHTAIDIQAIATAAPDKMQKDLPTAEAADKYLGDVVSQGLARLDANDLLYQIDSSRDYDPSAHLGDITAPVMWVNSADDFINPPELGIAERAVTRLKHGRFVLLPIGPNTHGHGTHTWAVAWKTYLGELLKGSQR